MEIINFILTILISASISTIISFLLKDYLKIKLEQKFQIELEKLKSELVVTTYIKQEFIKKSLEIYPAISELIYRARNLARDLNANYSLSSTSGLLEKLIEQIENYLYEERILLENSGMFSKIHRYKDYLKNFLMVLSKLEFFSERTDEEEINNSKRELLLSYKLIDKYHKEIVQNLSKQIESYNKKT